MRILIQGVAVDSASPGFFTRDRDGWTGWTCWTGWMDS